LPPPSQVNDALSQNLSFSSPLPPISAVSTYPFALAFSSPVIPSPFSREDFCLVPKQIPLPVSFDFS